ncbi:hypothetical protein Gpo141_00014046 [Globisporangium polare]
MKARLRLKTWVIVLVLVLHLTKQILFLSDILVMKRWPIQNHVMFAFSIDSHEVRFRVLPFLCSRQITTLIWCVRLLHRILTRCSENELVMLLGNVEYDYQQRRTQPKRIAPSATTASTDT